ncbi:hypothetical protein BC829DRAFT_373407 [Chytridium lagenaria]|nr:hypothetical protein BC829DRAFT_373407 [Chytridium lagenaria]
MGLFGHQCNHTWNRYTCLVKRYDYTTDTFRPLKLKSNVFCGGGMLLPDGRLTVLGGAENFTELGGLLDGMKSIRLCHLLDRRASLETRIGWMTPPTPRSSKRWYPSVVTLPEGRLLIIGGTTVAVAFTSPPNNTGTMEIIPPVRNYARPDDALIPLQFLWDTLPANLYPTSTVLPSGRIFITASDRATLLDPSQGYGALRTFLLRPSAASSASSSTTGICLQPPPNGESTLTGPTDFLTTRSCVGPSSFNQNRTADHPQTFSFYGAPIPSSTNTERYSNPLGFAQRDAYPGAGWVVHTESKMCLAVLGGAVGGRVGFKRCVAEDVEQLFDVGEGVVRHVGSGGCLGVTGTSVSVTACSNDASSSTRIDVVDTSVYFEFPRLPGGPFRSYPWTGTGLMLPLDPYDNYDPAVMVCGGSVHPQGLQAVESNTSIGLSTCGTIRPERPDANWTVEVMPSPRVLGDLIHLPDGTLLLLNGAQRGMAGWDLGRNPNLAAHLYNPLAPLGSRWSVLDSSTIPRMYHSSAMLLPDGRVMVAGSSPNSPTDRSWSRMYENEYRVEYFHPPYLLDRNASRPRPMIAEASWPSATVSWSYNTTYSLRVGVADPAATSTKGVRMLTTDEMGRRNVRFNIVQTGFRTHSTSFGQRLVWLVSQVGRSEGEVVLGAPPNAAVAPPGWYLLFAVMDGVPSEGKWVQVGGDPAELGKYYDV